MSSNEQGMLDEIRANAASSAVAAAAGASDQAASPQGIRAIIVTQLKENVLFVATLLAVLLGISLGFILRAFNFEFNDNQIAYFGFVGQLFLRMLKFLILPLIATSLISGIAGLSKSAGKIALRALVYYFSTTITAVVIGIILVVIIKPGSGKGSSVDASVKLPIDTNRIVTTHDTLLDLIRNLFPDNIVEMTFREYETAFVPVNKWVLVNTTSNFNRTIKELPANFKSTLFIILLAYFIYQFVNYLIDHAQSDTSTYYAVEKLDYYKAVASGRRSLNVLGVILFCFVFGGVLASMGKEAEIIVKIFEALNNCSVRMIKLVMV